LIHLDVGCYSWTGYKGFIKKIPAGILHLPKLNSLTTRGQPIEVPPPEVVKEGVEAIKNYWRQQQEVGVDYLAEAKLIIVGEAGAGKTSLAKKVEDPAYELKPQEVSTEGIDVIRWGFPCGVRVKKDGREELHRTDFKVSIWDFGGQEIYHATHQFFLTRRSLYLLVADDRREDTDFNYWLQVVELRSDRSPLLIVQNEKQDRQRPLDLGALRARFPNLREALRVNLADNRGLDELVKTIRAELERLPHIGTPLPKTWSQVRAALEGDPRNYISLDEFLDICQQNGFKRREDKLQLSGYLHDLGICLHFQEDDVLKNTVILKPKWGTDAVYSVLDDRGVLERRGRFGPEDLARIWADEKYADMRGELLRLMMRFQLCYQLPDRPVYIAPQLLSPTRPAYEWKGRNELVLRYEYKFMPKGILTRFIVAVNHLIADQGLVWKSGVILARDGSRAEVIEDYPLRKVDVRVAGADVRGLLAIVDDQLERIHASFPRLNYEKYLPCNCEVCRKREEPYAYPLGELKDFAAKGRGIQCRVSGDLVDAAELIRAVLPSAVYPPEMLPGQPAPARPEVYSPPEPPRVKEVFVSYAWSGESKAVVDQLEEAFKGRDVLLVRDKNEMHYKDSIRDFMQRIGRGKCVVVVLSKKYLESKSCMFELTQIAGRGDMRGRVFPVVLDDARIYDALDRLDYIDYWEQKKEALDAKMKKVGGQKLQGIREELDLFDDIRDTIAGIVDILADMNALTPEQHRGSDFGALLRELEARLSE
jgi:GTPase SAR1 family protein